jgi:hypothetical protein
MSGKKAEKPPKNLGMDELSAGKPDFCGTPRRVQPPAGTLVISKWLDRVSRSIV